MAMLANYKRLPEGKHQPTMQKTFSWILGIFNPYNHQFIIYQREIILYWLVVYLPVWKIWKSVGMMTFPIYGKIKAMFQTTNQLYYHKSLFNITMLHQSSFIKIGNPGGPSYATRPSWNSSLVSFVILCICIYIRIWMLSFIRTSPNSLTFTSRRSNDRIMDQPSNQLPHFPGASRAHEGGGKCYLDRFRGIFNRFNQLVDWYLLGDSSHESDSYI